jgi:hypothetical protein
VAGRRAAGGADGGFGLLGLWEGLADSGGCATLFERRRWWKPLTGIVAGYHVLPYVLVAPEAGHPGWAVEVSGRIRVSPRLVLGVGSAGSTDGEVFGERELMDRAVVARVFSFRYAPRLVLESDDLRIRRHDRDAPEQLARVLDDLARREIVDTGVIHAPDARFYPVSLDRFIREISTGSSASSLSPARPPPWPSW